MRDIKCPGCLFSFLLHRNGAFEIRERKYGFALF